MKKTITLFLIITLMFTFSAKSQNIQNLDFETWNTPTKAHNWSSRVGLSVTGISLPYSFEFGTRTADNHTGEYAIQLKPQSLGMLGTLLAALIPDAGIDFQNIVIPAIMQIGETENFNITTETIDLFMNFDISDPAGLLELASAFEGAITEGVDIISKPQYVKAWVKSNVADTITIAAFTKNGSDYAQMGVTIVDNATSWTEVTVNLTDLNSMVPEKIGIIIIGGGMSSSTTTSFFVDDITVDKHVNSIISSTPTFNIYPNPATDLVKIEMNGEYHVNIYDITGKKVIEQANLQNVSEINTSSLKSGVYMLEVVQGEKMQTKKIVIE